MNLVQTFSVSEQQYARIAKLGRADSWQMIVVNYLKLTRSNTRLEHLYLTLASPAPFIQSNGAQNPYLEASLPSVCQPKRSVDMPGYLVLLSQTITEDAQRYNAHSCRMPPPAMPEPEPASNPYIQGIISLCTALPSIQSPYHPFPAPSLSLPSSPALYSLCNPHLQCLVPWKRLGHRGSPLSVFRL